MNKTRHLGVYGLLINDVKVLLIKKARGAYTGKYDLPGGSIEHGETPIETLKRELMEEAGVKVNSAVLIDVNSVLVNWSYHEKMECMHHIGIMYKVKIDDGDIKTEADGLDSLGAVWVLLNNLNKDTISPLTYKLLRKFNYIDEK